MAPDKRGCGAGHVPLPSVVELRPLPSGPRPRRVVGERGIIDWPFRGRRPTVSGPTVSGCAGALLAVASVVILCSGAREQRRVAHSPLLDSNRRTTSVRRKSRRRRGLYGQSRVCVMRLRHPAAPVLLTRFFGLICSKCIGICEALLTDK